MLRTALLAAAQHHASWPCSGLQPPTLQALWAAPQCSRGSGLPHNIPPPSRVSRPTGPQVCSGLQWVSFLLREPQLPWVGWQGKNPAGFVTASEEICQKKEKKGCQEKATAPRRQAVVP